MRAACFAVAALLLGACRAWACGPDPAPAIAAAYGLTCEVFYPNMGAASTYDTGNTGASGYTWYINRIWNYAATWGSGIGGPNPTSASDYTINSPAGALTMNTTSSGNQYPGMMFSTCTPASNTVGYTGTTFAGSMYIDVTYSSSGSPTNDTGTVWMEPIEDLVPYYNYPGSTARWVEDDLFETQYGRSLYDLEYTGQTQDFEHQYQIALNQNGVNGTLIVAPQLNGGTGLVERANNDVAFDTVQFSPSMVPIADGSALSYPAGTYSPIAYDHYCMMISDGEPQVLTISKIQIWQAPPGTGGVGMVLGR